MLLFYVLSWFSWRSQGQTHFYLRETPFNPLLEGTLFVWVILKPINFSDPLIVLQTSLLLQRFWHHHTRSILQNVLGILTFMGPCIVRIFQYISKNMQRYTVYLYLKTALHVSCGSSTHHQERMQLYLQHLVFVRPYLPLAAGSSKGLTNTRCCRYSCMSP